jgi:hypothetical protein
MVIKWLMMVNTNDWLVVSAYPSEKKKSVGMMTFPSVSGKSCLTCSSHFPVTTKQYVLMGTNPVEHQGTIFFGGSSGIQSCDDYKLLITARCHRQLKLSVEDLGKERSLAGLWTTCWYFEVLKQSCESLAWFWDVLDKKNYRKPMNLPISVAFPSCFLCKLSLQHPSTISDS